ncbi:MAG: sigma-70 family RNA polymerase sigma factor [Ruminococcus sp.]|nr:sigma-70 family RNA polymerase sigma factor [Ruminococcus sp.]
MNEFEHYVERYSADLFRFCFKLCADQDDAEDLFQDTWTKALSKIDTYDSDRDFRIWLFSICVNTYKDTVRKKYNSLKIRFQNNEEKERFLRSIPTEQKDIDEYVDLYNAINSLNKKHRVVIALYYFKEFSVKEIAEILSIPEGTVHSRLNTAKKHLKRRLSHE